MSSKPAFFACVLAAAAAAGCPSDANDRDQRYGRPVESSAGVGAGQNADSRPIEEHPSSNQQISGTGMTNQNTGATLQGRRAPVRSRSMGDSKVPTRFPPPR